MSSPFRRIQNLIQQHFSDHWKRHRVQTDIAICLFLGQPEIVLWAYQHRQVFHRFSTGLSTDSVSKTRCVNRSAERPHLGACFCNAQSEDTAVRPSFWRCSQFDLDWTTGYVERPFPVSVPL